MDEPQYLTTAEMCELLQVTARTLQKKRFRDLFTPEWLGHGKGWRYSVAVVRTAIEKLKQQGN